jgi:hypothetical protein
MIPFNLAEAADWTTDCLKPVISKPSDLILRHHPEQCSDFQKLSLTSAPNHLHIHLVLSHRGAYPDRQRRWARDAVDAAASGVTRDGRAGSTP